MKNKGISIFTLLLLLIIILGIGILIGYFIPKNNQSNSRLKQTTQNEIKDTNTSNVINNISGTNNITNTLSTNTLSTNTLTENTIVNSTNSSEIKIVEELFKNFAKAVNAKDWATVENYSNSNIVSQLKKYNVTSMLVGDDTVQENPNQAGGYTCLCSYNIDYNGMSTKDLMMGNMMLADKVNGNFVITSFCATGM